ncbi:hypothetical protein GNI_177500 [Gregarina niphandrodes]|uniref:Ankyrin repeat protein n=1 Tax=Gregarina niphandrodes TaxID=110365 RepID=A0A023AXW0_GRENI|nr:hypothetical protein GNI_177500 [Gregarina niphandrodes]EZG43303.1 hypothetical protein GNI_177500 [Gregarina niphandrodes]|eukprot:XP_011133445.1 hypothetical protein GNI_177500 [Gregarina niphandrodes]
MYLEPVVLKSLFSHPELLEIVLKETLATETIINHLLIYLERYYHVSEVEEYSDLLRRSPLDILADILTQRGIEKSPLKRNEIMRPLLTKCYEPNMRVKILIALTSSHIPDRLFLSRTRVLENNLHPSLSQIDNKDKFPIWRICLSQRILNILLERKDQVVFKLGANVGGVLLKVPKLIPPLEQAPEDLARGDNPQGLRHPEGDRPVLPAPLHRLPPRLQRRLLRVNHQLENNEASEDASEDAAEEGNRGEWESGDGEEGRPASAEEDEPDVGIEASDVESDEYEPDEFQEEMLESEDTGEQGAGGQARGLSTWMVKCPLVHPLKPPFETAIATKDKAFIEWVTDLCPVADVWPTEMAPSVWKIILSNGLMEAWENLYLKGYTKPAQHSWLCYAVPHERAMLFVYRLYHDPYEKRWYVPVDPMAVKEAADSGSLDAILFFAQRGVDFSRVVPTEHIKTEPRTALASCARCPEVDHALLHHLTVRAVAKDDVDQLALFAAECRTAHYLQHLVDHYGCPLARDRLTPSAVPYAISDGHCLIERAATKGNLNAVMWLLCQYFRTSQPEEILKCSYSVERFDDRCWELVDVAYGLGPQTSRAASLVSAVERFRTERDGAS